MINNPLNCWEILKLHIPQHKVETPMCDGGESRKKYVDCIRLNPKCHNNGQSAAKLRTGEGSTTKCFQAEDCGGHPETDEDIVCTSMET